MTGGSCGIPNDLGFDGANFAVMVLLLPSGKQCSSVGFVGELVLIGL